MFRVLERVGCRVKGQHRSTQRHSGKVVHIEEATLRRRLREIAAEHNRWGRRMAYRLLRREGWTVNHKRVQRLWREEGLNVIDVQSRLCMAIRVGGLVRPMMWCSCWRSSSAFIQRRRSFAAITAPSSSPTRLELEAGTTPQTAPTSRQDPKCRRTMPIRSTDDSGMNPSTWIC